jgi:N-acetylmuramic acid 6-phosphate (MurNAc-6-P) etherase
MSNTPQIDDAVTNVINHLMRSPRMRAASIALSQRINMLDALEQAGFNINNASVTVLFDGKVVTSIVRPDDKTELRGGGAVPFTR